MANRADQILEAAVICFGRDGFSVGLREIGAEAGCSAALIVRHFGSKDGLRRACDEHVAQVIFRVKLDAVEDTEMASIIDQLARAEEYSDVFRYLLRSLMTPSPLTRDLLNRLVDDAVDYLGRGEAAGLIKPSRDPIARARYLTYSGLGAAVLQLQLVEAGGDLSSAFNDVIANQLVPSIELFTQGLFTDSRVDQIVAAFPNLTHPATEKGQP